MSFCFPQVDMGLSRHREILEAAIADRIRRAASTKEMKVRQMATDLLNQGYRPHELCLFEQRRALDGMNTHFYVGVDPDIKRTRFRLWFRRQLIAWHLRPTAMEIFVDLDRKKQRLEVKVWQR